MRLLGAMLFAACGVVAPAHANSNGAPWGAADPDTFQSCAACHFDREPIGRSPSLMLTGLPEYAAPGEAYELTLRFDMDGAPNAGFLLSASTGAFEAVDEFLEVQGNEVRSTQSSVPTSGSVLWRFLWRAAKSNDETVIFRAAANAANDDQSPFGDKIHFRKFEIFTAPPGE